MRNGTFKVARNRHKERPSNHAKETAKIIFFLLMTCHISNLKLKMNKHKIYRSMSDHSSMYEMYRSISQQLLCIHNFLFLAQKKTSSNANNVPSKTLYWKKVRSQIPRSMNTGEKNNQPCKHLKILYQQMENQRIIQDMGRRNNWAATLHSNKGCRKKMRSRSNYLGRSARRQGVPRGGGRRKP